MMPTILSSSSSTIISSNTVDEPSEPILDIYPVSSFVACTCERQWWIGTVKLKSDEHNDLLISFMHPSGEAKQYSWPQKEDACCVEKRNIICGISCPSLTSSSMRGYSFSDYDINRIKDLFQSQ